MNALAFNSVTFNPVNKDNQIWLTSSEIAQALEYAHENSITRVYERNKSEFAPSMSEKVKLTLSGNLQTDVRIFSLRGAHLLAMFARTPVAADFRRWLLDIADREVNTLPAAQDQIPGFSNGHWLLSVTNGRATLTPAPQESYRGILWEQLPDIIRQPGGHPLFAIMPIFEACAERVLAAHRLETSRH